MRSRRVPKPGVCGLSSGPCDTGGLCRSRAVADLVRQLGLGDGEAVSEAISLALPIARTLFEQRVDSTDSPWQGSSYLAIPSRLVILVNPDHQPIGTCQVRRCAGGVLGDLAECTGRHGRTRQPDHIDHHFAPSREIALRVRWPLRRMQQHVQLLQRHFQCCRQLSTTIRRRCQRAAFPPADRREVDTHPQAEGFPGVAARCTPSGKSIPSPGHVRTPESPILLHLTSRAFAHVRGRHPGNERRDSPDGSSTWVTKGCWARL